MIAELTVTKTNVKLRRMRTDSGEPLWRASLADSPFCRRHAPTREEALKLLIEAYLMPEAKVTIGKKEPAHG